MNTKRKAEHDRWRNMILRCSDPKHISYKYYGLKGISVCKRWADSFQNFLDDMGYCPPGLSLDRIDSKQPYSKENCRWATWTEQNNNKSDTRIISFQGRSMNLTKWAIELGFSVPVLHYRIVKMKLPIEIAFTLPITPRNKRRNFSLEIK